MNSPPLRQHPPLFRWRSTLLKIAFSTALFLLAMKLGDLTVGAINNTHERHLLRLSPRASVTHRTREFEYVYATNSLGFRGREATLPRPPQTARVLVIGDSFVAGMGVSHEHVFTEQLGESMASAGNSGSDSERTWEFINLGRPGSGPARECDFYERIGRKLEPTAVLLVFFLGNDLVDAVAEHDAEELAAWRPQGAVRSAAYGCFPNLYLELAMLKQAARPAWELQPRNQAEAIAAIRAAAVARSTSSEDVVARFESLPADFRAAWQEGALAEHRMLLVCTEPKHLALALDPDDAYWRQAWPRVERQLERLLAACRRDGSPLGIVVIPDQVQVDKRALEFSRELGLEVRDNWGQRDCRTQRALQSWSRAHHVPLLDVTAAFRKEVETEGEPLYFLWDTHLNARGHGRLAREIAAWIAERDW